MKEGIRMLSQSKKNKLGTCKGRPENGIALVQK
jgi:hypothetical protein